MAVVVRRMGSRAARMAVCGGSGRAKSTTVVYVALDSRGLKGAQINEESAADQV